MYKSNLEKLLASKKPIVLRIPVIGGYTDDGENRNTNGLSLEKMKTAMTCQRPLSAVNTVLSGSRGTNRTTR